MKKLSFILAALLVCGAMQAQTNSETCWDFENDFAAGHLLEWTTIDADGDGHDWQIYPTGGMGYSGSDGMVVSYSKDIATGDSLTPSNYLVSPRIRLDGLGMVSFWACALDTANPAEHIGVFVSTTTNDDPMAFTMMQHWTLYNQGNWYNYMCDLSQYCGQEVYIAIRHFYCSGNCAVCFDDFCVDGECVGVEEEAESIGVYPNPARDRVVIEGMEAVEVMVYNTSGQMVKCVRGTNEIDLSGLVDGVYLLRISDAEGKVYTNKITVQ